MKAYKAEDLFYNAWSSLSLPEYLKILELLPLYNQTFSKTISREERGILKKKILERLCKNKKIFKKLTGPQLLDLFKIADFITRPDPDFHVKKLKIKTKLFYRNYFSPDFQMKDSTFYEFIKADTYFSRHIITGSESQLDLMIAVLYRPVEMWSRKKKKFDDNNVEDKAKRISSISPALKAAIFFDYSICRTEIIKSCPNLFPAPLNKKSDDDVEENGGCKDMGPVWLDILTDAGEMPYFKGNEGVKEANVYEVLYYLDKKAKERLQSNNTRHATA